MMKNPELAITGMPIDMVCVNRAKERGLNVGNLDEIQPQDSLAKKRDTMNENLNIQIDSLMAYLNDFDQRKQGIINEISSAAQSTKQWKTGDYNSFANTDFWIKQVENQPGIFKIRNERWLPKIEAAMSEMPTLFVFGAGHLIGTNGIIQGRNQNIQIVLEVRPRHGTDAHVHHLGNLYAGEQRRWLQGRSDNRDWDVQHPCGCLCRQVCQTPPPSDHIRQCLDGEYR